jgi:cell division protein FtsI (penicillin-binding protein 3)
VVLMGTAHGAVHLNGYSAAGKTGTAQKIDPRTRTYSKTKFVASFVGFAPVNNPAITIAVVMDSPDHSMHFGAQASAPVFQELAQQILEYVGVPHDQELRSAPETAKELAGPAPEEHSDDFDGNVEQLFAEVNNLPADDPLRQPAETATKTEAVTAPAANTPPVAAPRLTNTALVMPTQAGTAQSSTPANSEIAQNQLPPPVDPKPTAPAGKGAVVVDSSKRVAVPSFLGEPLRHVIEEAGTTGLAVNVVGDGLAREQAPAAGTMVPAGTAVVVRFSR